MRKNLFFTCALALASVAGVNAQNVNAQDWCHTLATGTTGTQVTNEIDGTSVTQYRAATKLFNHAGTTGVRYSVVETTPLNQLHSYGPCWAMGEMIVLDANGDTIPYTATSNAGHNELTGGTDGQGLEALNDGKLNNYFHTVWNSSYDIADAYHWIELDFGKSVDAFQLVWYTRPNQHQNRPLIIGLTPAGVDFTEESLYSEYQFSLGEQVTSAADLADENAFFAMYIEGETSYSNGEEEFTGPGNVFVSMGHNSYNVGTLVEAHPKSIVQLIPGNGENVFAVYMPVTDVYLADASAWSGNYNGANGWQYAYNQPKYLQEIQFTERKDGDFELSYEIEHEGETITVWIGYDMRGSLKIFPAEEKERLETAASTGDYSGGSFALPVDFGFSFYKTNVAEGVIERLSVASIADEVLTPAIEEAREYIATYGDHEGYDEDDTKGALEEVISAAEDALEANDLAGIFTAKDEVAAALSEYLAQRVYLLYDQIAELVAEWEGNNVTPPYTMADEGKYTSNSKNYLDNAEAVCANVESNYETMSAANIIAAYDQVAALMEQFRNSALKFSTFPALVTGISNAVSADYENNAVWRSNDLVLNEAINGVRLTVTSVYIGSAAGGGLFGGFPMLALGELKLYDANGDEVALTEANVMASATEVNEGFESTAARLVDGVITGAGSYFHSPWGGTAPSELVYIEVTFPEPMSAFTVELYSRDKSTTGGMVSLWPSELAISNLGQKYDPLLFAANPYNVKVGEQVTAVTDITDGIYVIRGLLNTHPVYGLDEDGNLQGAGSFYNGVERFHESVDAVREDCVFRIKSNSDGTFNILSFGEGKYWPSSTSNDYVSSTVYKSLAANIKIEAVADQAIENSFVLYEEHADLTTVSDSTDTDEDGILDSATETATPYVVYMDWNSGLATRPVVSVQPRSGVADDADDAWGDSLCFNKGNGEGQWQIYKVVMDNADYALLSGMVEATSSISLLEGNDPGRVADMGNYPDALAAAEACVADSVYAEAAGNVTALENAINGLVGLERTPMTPGYYMIVSAFPTYYEQQNVEKAMYVNPDALTLGWKNANEADKTFYFDFQPSSEAEILLAEGVITEEQAAILYTIRPVGTIESNEWYVSETSAVSTQIDVAEWASNYIVQMLDGASSFNLSPATNASWSLHTNGHSNGAGVSGNLVYWYGDSGASQWYLKKVDYTPTAIEDVVVEGDEVVSVAYYTVGGASSSAPVKGINIVRIVYANGVVETKKILVK